MCLSYTNPVSTISVVFFKQKTPYELRISDWSSDVCSSDLGTVADAGGIADRTQQADLFRDPRFGAQVAGARCIVEHRHIQLSRDQPLEQMSAESFDDPHGNIGKLLPERKIGRASCRERVCQYV